MGEVVQIKYDPQYTSFFLFIQKSTPSILDLQINGPSV
jgi:hypothetical protein